METNKEEKGETYLLKLTYLTHDATSWKVT